MPFFIYTQRYIKKVQRFFGYHVAKLEGSKGLAERGVSMRMAGLSFEEGGRNSLAQSALSLGVFAQSALSLGVFAQSALSLGGIT